MAPRAIATTGTACLLRNAPHGFVLGYGISTAPELNAKTLRKILTLNIPQEKFFFFSISLFAISADSEAKAY